LARFLVTTHVTPCSTFFLASRPSGERVGVRGSTRAMAACESGNALTPALSQRERE
jgi:hypothetical protein